MSRLKADRYYTVPALAAAIVQRCRDRGLVRGHVVEPSCGTGAFLRELSGPGVESVTGVDIELTPEAKDWSGLSRFVEECDWLKWGAPGISGHIDLVIGNPPFDGAEAHIRHALELISPTGAVVMLLRSSLVGSGERVIPGWSSHLVPLWQQHRPTWVDVVAPRPSFTGGGSDTAEYVVVTWQPAAMAAGWGPTRLDWLVWRQEKHARTGLRRG